MFSLFGSSGDKDFVKSMVERLTKEMPAKLMEQHTKVLSVNRITSLLERNAGLAKEYKEKNNAGYFRRVGLINSYRWALVEAGYSNEFVKIAVESLVVAFSKK